MKNDLNIMIAANLDKQKSVTQINNDIEKIQGQLKKLKLQAGLDKGKTNAEIQKQISELNKQKRQLNVDLKIRKNALKNEFKELQRQTDTTLNIDTTNAQRQINDTTNAVRNASNESVTLANSIKKVLNNAGLTISAQTALQLIRKAAAEATEAIREYDRYATNLSVITGGARSDSNKIISDLAEKSLEFKVDLSDLEGAEETLLRTGKSIDETNKYLENTIYLSKLGFQDMDTSASQLVTIGNAYGYTANEMANVVDKFVKLDTQANVTAGDLAEGVAKSAQNAKLAGFNIDQLSASIAALKDATGNAETQVANSLNMIFSRLQNVKLGKYVVESEDGTEDITEALNDTEKLLNTMNIRLRDSKGEFRDISELFTELSEKWENFNSVQQSAIATTIAGARQRNTFIALIENWNKIQELTDVSLNSTGTAVQKYESYLDSVEAKTSELNTSLKELWNDLLPEQFIGNMTEAGTAVVQFTDKYRILQTLLKSALIYGAANGLVASFNGLGSLITNLNNNVSYAMNLASKGTALTATEFTALKVATKGLSDSQLKLILSSSNLDKAQKMQLVSTENLSQAEIQQKYATLGIVQAEATATTATFSLSGAFKTLWATMLANPLMTVVMIFGAVKTAIEVVKAKQDEARQAAVDSINTYREQTNAIEELRQKYTDIVDSEMTDSEKTKELNEWKQTLIETYGFEKEALENVNFERKKSLDLLDEEIKKQNRENRGEWLGTNKDAIEKAVRKIENPSANEIPRLVDGTVEGDIFNPIKIDEIDESVKELFRSVTQLGNATHFRVAGNNLIEYYDNIQKVISKLGNKKKLNESEKNLLDGLNEESAAIKKVLDENLEIYQTYYEYTAENNFEDYAANKPIEDVGKNTYLAWKKGLINTADNDVQLEKELEEIAERQFPEYEKYFDDLANAYNMFGVDDIVNDANEGTKKLFINSLSDEDLAILIQLDKDIFDRGIDGVEKAIADFKTDPKNIVEAEINTTSMEELQTRYEEIGKSVDTFIKNQKTVKSAFEELEKHGQLSADTIKDLIGAGYASALMYDKVTGAVTISTEEYNKLNLEKKKSLQLDIAKLKVDLINPYKDQSLAIADLERSLSSLNETEREATQIKIDNMRAQLASSQLTDEEIAEKEKMLAELEAQLASLDAPTFDDKKSKKDKPQKVLDYEEWVAKAEHEIAMGLNAEDKAYYDEKISRARTAYKNLEDYQSDLWKVEEEYYKWCNDQDEELFEKRIDNYEKLADKVLDGKLSLEDFRKEMENFNNEMQKTYGLGNVDLTKRPLVDMPDGSTATVLSSTEFIWQSDEESGKYIAVHYTPILPDGTVLDDNTLNDYLYNVLESSENILDADKNGLGIVLKVDTDLNISDDDISSLETDKPTENIQNIIAACDEWDVSLHEIQEDWVEMSKLFDDNGNFVVSASFDYARSEINAAIEETQNRINELSLKPGFEDEVESLIKDLEDLNDKLDEIDKKEIESEKKYINDLKSKYSDMMDDRIDSNEEMSKAIKKRLEDEIDIIDNQSKAYDKQIDAIEKANDAEKRKTDILEAQKKVREAELELEKAHVKNRLVYTGNGRYEAREDKNAVKEAEEKLAEAKTELENKQQEEQINLLKDQKSALEDQNKVLEEAKDNSDEYYDNITDNLEKQKETGEKTYDALIDILDNVNGESKQKASNTELYQNLIESGDLDKAINNLSATELKEAIESGILKVDDKGNYTVDYSAIENYNEVVESNSDTTKENTEAINNLDETMQKFMPDDSENAATTTPTDTQNENSSKVKPITYSEWQKKHKLSEYAPHGKDVPDMTFEEYLSGKKLKTETIKSDIKHYGDNGKISNSDLDKYFKENGLDNLVKQITEGVSNVVPTANEIFGQQMKMIMGGQNINQGGVVNNVMNASGRPQFNCTINIDGSADEKTVDRMKTEMDSMLCEYTDALTRTINTEFMKRKYR